MYLWVKIQVIGSIFFCINYDNELATGIVVSKRGISIILGLSLLLIGSGYFINESAEVLQSRSVRNEEQDEIGEDSTEEKDFIKWVEFDVTCEAMSQAYQYDIDTYTKEVHLNWVDLLAYLGAKYGGDFSKYKEKDMNKIAIRLLEEEITVEKIAEEMEYFSYYREAYGAVLDGMVGEYEVEHKDEDSVKGESAVSENEKLKTAWKRVYGLKAYHPIAKGFPYSDYDDFGSSRSYGFKRIHLGHDMMGQVGTPVIAIESGYVAELGWNQYGGWRIGINSFDGKRYYYYAHLRKDRPYAEGLEKGDVVQAGDVIGYVGRTGYSAKENVNNIDEYHLHFGLQLIFDESQRDSDNEIWVSGYELVKFLYKHRSEVQRNDATKEWTRVYGIKDPEAEEYERMENSQ